MIRFFTHLVLWPVLTCLLYVFMMDCDRLGYDMLFRLARICFMVSLIMKALAAFGFVKINLRV